MRPHRMFMTICMWTMMVMTIKVAGGTTRTQVASRIGITNTTLPPPQLIPNYWNEPQEVLAPEVQICRPYLMVNDIIDPFLWFYACTIPAPHLLLRYHILTNASMPLVLNYSVGSFRPLARLQQNSLGQIFWMASGGSIAYLDSPATATLDTPLIWIWDLETLRRRQQVCIDFTLPDRTADQIIIAVQPLNYTERLAPSVISYNLTTTNSTTLLLFSLCPPFFLAYDYVNHSALVYCNQDRLIYSIPLNSTEPPSIVAVFPLSAAPLAMIRGQNSIFVSVLNNDGPSGIFAFTNTTIMPSTPILPLTPNTCNLITSWFYDRRLDELLVTCTTSRIGQNSAFAFILQDLNNPISSPESTILSPVCQSDTNVDVTSIVPDPFFQGFYLTCTNNLYHLTGKEVTTLTEVSSYCPATASIQSDSTNGLVISTCGPSLLVVDGGQSWQTEIDGYNSDQILQFVHSSETGMNYLIATNASSFDYALVQVSPITREMMLNNEAPQATVLFSLPNGFPALTIGGATLFLFFDGPFNPFNPYVQYLNTTSGQLFNLSTDAYPLISQLYVMDQFLYFTCFSGIYRLPLSDLTATPTFIVNLPDPCQGGFTSLAGSSSTNRLWLLCVPPITDNNDSLMMFDMTTQLIQFIPIPVNGVNFEITVDDGTSLVILYGGGTTFIYDPNMNMINLNPVSIEDCDMMIDVEINEATSVIYAACNGGRIIAMSNNFACQAGYQFSRFRCTICPAGYARGQIDSSTALSVYPTCQPCAPGTIAIQPGSSICQPCPIGRFQDLTLSQQVCSYCQPGTYQNLTGATICQSCPLGRFTGDVGLSVCQDCLPGRYANTNASTACTLCDRGSASNLTGLTIPCPDCPAGSEQLQFGGTACAVCPLGHYSSKGDPCYTCLLNSYQTSRGLECLPCDGQNQDGLICLNGLASVKSGYWAYQVYDPQINQTIFQTTECPPNYCSGSPLQLSNTSTSNGIDGSIIYCSYPRLSSSENWLCAECVDGYVVWGTECVECSKVNGLFITVLIIFLFLLVGFFLKSGMGAAGRMTILLYFAQTAALELNQHTTSTNVHWLQVVNLSLLSINTCFAPLSPLQQILFTYFSPFILFLVLLLIGLVHRLLDHYRLWSSLYQRFEINSYIACTLTILLFSYTNVTVSVVKSLNCVTIAPEITVLFTQPTISCHSNDYQQILLPITLVWLIIYVIGFPIGMSIFLYYHRKQLVASSTTTHRSSDLSDRPLSPLDDLSRSLNEPLSPSSPIMSSDGVGDDMEVDQPSLTVDDSGFNVTITSNLDDNTTGSGSIRSNVIRTVDGRPLTEFDHRWGLLYLEFSSSGWYGQSWILLRRFAFALTSVLIIRSPTTTFVSFTALNFFALLIHLAAQPFRSHTLNKVETGSHVVLTVISLILTIYATSRPLWIEIILLLFVIPPTIVFAIYTLRHHIREYRTKRKHRRQARQSIIHTNNRYLPSTQINDQRSQESKELES